MRKNRKQYKYRRKRIITACVLSASFFCLAILVISSVVSDRKSRRQAGLEEEKNRPYRVEINRKERELEKLKAEYEQKLNGSAVSGVIVTDMREEVYTEIYPELGESGYAGVIAVSEKAFDDYISGEDVMTEEQLNEMMEAGWRWCPAWLDGNGPEQLQYVLESMPLQEYGLQDVVYFADGAYTPEMDAELAAMGYSVVLHHGEKGMPLISPEEGDVMHIGVNGLRGDMAKYWADKAVSDRGTFYISVGFSEEAELFDESAIESLLDYFQQYESNGDLVLYNPREAADYKRGLALQQSGVHSEYEGKISGLEKEIEELQAEIENGK